MKSFKLNILERLILGILYFYNKEISKEKLAAILFLLLDRIKELKEHIDPYIYIKSLKLHDSFVDRLIDYHFDLKHFIDVDYIKDTISLIKSSYKNIKELIESFPKEELDAIKAIIEQYGNQSEKELADLIIEKAKKSLIQ
jgi:hypothetical protein